VSHHPLGDCAEWPVITLEMLSIYERYGGDADTYARAAGQADRTALSDDDWSRIDTLVQDLILVVRGLAAPAFAQCAQDAIKLVAAMTPRSGGFVT